MERHPRQLVIAQDSLEPRGQRERVPRVEEQPRPLVTDQRAIARAVGGNAGKPGRHRLDQRLGVTFGERGQHESVRAGEPPGHQSMVDDARKLHSNSHLARLGLEGGAEGAGPDHDQLGRQPGRKRGHRLDESGEILLLREAADVENAPPAAPAPVGRREPGEVDAVRDDVNAIGGLPDAAVVRHAGARYVVITDVNEWRLELARKMGVTLAMRMACRVYTVTGTSRLGTLLGYGSASDGFHIAAPEPEGRGLERAIPARFTALFETSMPGDMAWTCSDH